MKEEAARLVVDRHTHTQEDNLLDTRSTSRCCLQHTLAPFPPERQHQSFHSTTPHLQCAARSCECV